MEQTVRIIEMAFEMLTADQRQLTLLQLNEKQGIRVDVARMYPDREIAARYDVNVRTIRKWIGTGKLTGCRIDGRWYSRADWLDDFDKANVVAI